MTGLEFERSFDVQDLLAGLSVRESMNILNHAFKAVDEAGKKFRADATFAFDRPEKVADKL